MIDYQDLLRELNEISGQQYMDVCEKYADMKQVFYRMEDLTKTCHGQCKIKIINDTEEKIAANTLDSMAYCAEEYVNFVKEKARARGVFYEVELEKEALKNRQEALITMLSFIKEQMRLT